MVSKIITHPDATQASPPISDSENGTLVCPDSPRDHFERLVNTPGTGTLQEMATAKEDITLTRGFMTDLDPYHFKEGGPLDVQAGRSPKDFYELYLRDRLQRSPFWKNAEVICTGNGLALVQRFNEPLMLRQAIDVERFNYLVKIAHTSLPSDPDQGGICQMPRIPGSVNTKRNQFRPVVLLAQGTPITHQLFDDFVERLCREPMPIILETLFGAKRICPCPLCNHVGTQLRLSPESKVPFLARLNAQTPIRNPRGSYQPFLVGP